MSRRLMAALSGALLLSSPVAYGDFLIIDKSLLKGAPAATAAASADPIIEGYGEGVRLGDVLPEIVPKDWVFSTSADLEDATVNWKGGMPWKPILRRIAIDNRWHIVVDDERKVVTLSNDKPVAVAKAAQASAVAVTESAKGAGQVVEKATSTAPAQSIVRHNYDVIKGSLEDRVNVSLRGKTLREVLHVLAPQGWQVDMQVPPYLVDTLIDYTAETTRQKAFVEVLQPMGLMLLPYPNMSPAPLLVIVTTEKN